MSLPVIGITMGDPSGNGPELSVKLLTHPELYTRCKPLIIGHEDAIREAMRVVKGAENHVLHVVTDVSEAVFRPGTIDVYHVPGFQAEKRHFRKDRAKLVAEMGEEAAERLYEQSRRMCGDCAFQYIVTVIRLAMEKKVDATVTNALNKDHINMAGHHFSGHTEIYAEYTNTPKYSMMLAHENLRVVHVSTHVSLRDACDAVKKDRVLDVIRLADHACRAIGIETPRIAVAGLNPHCGEHGLFGREEIEEIQPAIDAALSEGIDIPDRAPMPPDTVFSKAIGGWYDIVVCMYHDQGHIPLKVKGFVYDREKKRFDTVSGVNITLGLPIIRASVDHGTGENHAGDGSANEISLFNAADYAIRMANTASGVSERERT